MNNYLINTLLLVKKTTVLVYAQQIPDHIQHWFRYDLNLHNTLILTLLYLRPLREKILMSKNSFFKFYLIVDRSFLSKCLNISTEHALRYQYTAFKIYDFYSKPTSYIFQFTRLRPTNLTRLFKMSHVPSRACPCPRCVVSACLQSKFGNRVIRKVYLLFAQRPV